MTTKARMEGSDLVAGEQLRLRLKLRRNDRFRNGRSLGSGKEKREQVLQGPWKNQHHPQAGSGGKEGAQGPRGRGPMTEWWCVCVGGGTGTRGATDYWG